MTREAELPRLVVKVASKRGFAIRIAWARGNTGDLQRFLPIWVRDEDANDEISILVFVRIDANGMPDLLGAVFSDPLANLDREGFVTDLQAAGFAGVAVDLEFATVGDLARVAHWLLVTLHHFHEIFPYAWKEA